YGGSTLMNAKISANPPPLEDGIAPVAGLVAYPMILVAHPVFPAKTVPELIDYAKSNPGKVTMASFGIGTASHLAGELLKQMAGIAMVHVPYRGGAPMITDLLAGQVQIGFDVMVTSLPHVRTGALRALAVAGSRRFEALRVHHAARRRGRRVPARGARTAAGDAGGWVPQQRIAQRVCAASGCVPPGTERGRICRASERGDRISLGGE